MRNSIQIEAILESLCDVCAEALSARGELDAARRDELVRSLSINGWERHNQDGKPLSVIVKERTLRKYPEPAMHRGAELERLTLGIENAYQRFARYKVSAP